MIIINVSSEAILRNFFVSAGLKGVRGLLIKLNLVSFKVTFFVDYMWDNIHFTTKRPCVKYKIVLFYKYIFVPCGNMLKSDQLLLVRPRGELYKEECVLECLLRFAEIPEFVRISSFTTASFCVNF